MNARRTLTLLAGSAGGQAIALALAPLLTRLYAPAAFGQLGAFLAIATLLAPVAAFGLDAAIVLERDVDRAAEAFGTALALATLVASATAAIACLAARPATGMLLGASVGCLGLGQILANRALGCGRTRAVAAGRLARSAGIGAAQAALACTSLGGGTALVAGAVAGQLAAVLATASLLRGTPLPRFGLGRAASLARRHRPLLLWSAPQTLLNNAGNAAVPLLLGRLAGIEALGAWTLANRVVMLPASTLGEALRQSLLVSMAAAPDEASLLAELRRTTRRLALPLGAAVALAFATGPVVFAAAFGPSWRSAGADAALLLAAEAVGICNIPAVIAITVRRRQRALFLAQAATLPVRVALVAAAAAAGGAMPALATHAILSACWSAGVSLAMRRHLRASPPPLAWAAA